MPRSSEEFTQCYFIYYILNGAVIEDVPMFISLLSFGREAFEVCGACWWEMDLKSDAEEISETTMVGGTDRRSGRTVVVGEAKRREPGRSRQTMRHTQRTL